MAEDLGTWPPEQATVLVEVLQQAGITPQARRTRDGIEVTVDEKDSDQAHATLVANMDTIARAARSTPSEPRRKRPRTAPTGPKQAQRDAPERQLTSQRMTRFGRPMAILLAALLLAMVLPGALRVLVLAAAVAAMVWMLGREPDEDES